jgi:predicted nucleic acid-binding protein
MALSGQIHQRVGPRADLLIGTTAPELGYAVATHNIRHFQLIPDLIVKQI